MESLEIRVVDSVCEIRIFALIVVIEWDQELKYGQERGAEERARTSEKNEPTEELNDVISIA